MRRYDSGFKTEAMKLAREIGLENEATQLNIPYGTLNSWMYPKNKTKNNDGEAKIVPKTAEEIKFLKRIRELERSNQILKDALGFFAKSQKVLFWL